MAKSEKIGIIGSGYIGRSWAMLYASSGYNVVMYDVESSQLDFALDDINQQLQILEQSGMLRGTLTAKEQYKLISKCDSLKDCVKGAILVQESVFERLDLKKQVFKQMDEVASDSVILCSSTSCFPCSSFSDDLEHRSQVIVGHPVNPPYYVPLVELVPAPWTSPSVVMKTKEIMTEIGQKPVILKKEVLGFGLNRIQYAILNECWRLVQNGIMSVEDVDKTMSEGLGMRYAFLGPLETAHLNADGMIDYMDRYAGGIYNVSDSFGPNPKMEGATLQDIHNQLCEITALEKLADRRKWRDARLAALAKLKRNND